MHREVETSEFHLGKRASDATFCLLDRYGNRLQCGLALEGLTSEAPLVSNESSPGASTAWYARWQLWGGAAVALAAAGTWAGLSANAKAEELGALEDGADYSAALALADASRNRARMANVAFAAAGGCAATALFMMWRAHRSVPDESKGLSLTPQVGDGVGMSATFRF